MGDKIVIEDCKGRFFTEALLLCFFFITKEYLFLLGVLGAPGYSQKTMTLFSILFLICSNKRRDFLKYYSVKRLSRRDVRIGFVILICIFLYKVDGVTFNETPVKEAVIKIAQNGAIFWTTPFLEELFFTGIVFNTLRNSFANNKYFTAYRRDSLQVCIIPFLVTFYWFFLGHLYQTNFLNRDYDFLHRSFPMSILVVFFASILAFVKTRSLIFSTVIHYTANSVVFIYLNWFYSGC